MTTLLGAGDPRVSGSPSVLQLARVRLQERLCFASRLVTCTCSRGILLLRGRVATYYQKQMAQEAVKGLEGVDQVINEIEVGT